jgi:hypothetical protein
MFNIEGLQGGNTILFGTTDLCLWILKPSDRHSSILSG